MVRHWRGVSVCARLILALVFAGAATQSQGVVISSQINAGTDDAEEAIGGGVSTGSSDLEINYDGGDARYVGIFFGTVNVPAAATICSNTCLHFEADESNSEPVSVIIYGEDDEQAALSTANSNISNRTPTTAEVAWVDIPDWTSGVDYHSSSVQIWRRWLSQK